MNIFRLSIFVCAVALSSNGLCETSPQNDWKWVSGQTSPSGWFMTEGTSEAHIEKGKITVSLQHSDFPEHVLQLLKRQINRGCAAALSSNGLCETSPQNDWKWVSGQTSPSGWFMTEGTAEVHIEKGKITASLQHTGFPEHVVQLLEGQINRGAVRVNRTTMESDVGVEKLTGTYEKSNSPSYISESIIVSNKWGFVAITRTLKSDDLIRRSRVAPQKRGAP